MSENVKSWAYVIVQGILLTILVFFTDNHIETTRLQSLFGRAMMILGGVLLAISLYDLRKSLTALPTPVQHGKLQIRGLYRFARHPMYVAVLVLSAGIAVASGYWPKYVIVLCLALLFSYKARFEESLLMAKYLDYAKYMKSTPRFFPKFRR